MVGLLNKQIKMLLLKKNDFSLDLLKNDDFKGKLHLLFSIFIVFLAFLNLGQDFLHAARNQYIGYLSESVLYKVFWVLFIPSFYLLDKWISYVKKRGSIKRFWLLNVGILSLFILIHISLVSLLIVLGSFLFFEDSFRFYTPFGYFVSEYSLLTTIVYLISAAGLALLGNLKVKQAPITETLQPVLPLEFLTITLLNKQYPIPVKEILFIQSDRPYISIQTQQGGYLYNSSLNAILEKLQNPRFLRIHKSTILNLDQVSFFSSRSNGDYDITLKNGQVVRLSRNYFSAFKQQME